MNQPVPRTEAAQDRQAAGLRTLNEIQQEARQCNRVAELRYLAANRTGALIAYRQAAVFERRGGRVKVTAISGVSEFDGRAAFVKDLQKILNDLNRREGGRRRLLETGSVSADDCRPAARALWTESLPAEALVLPFRTRSDRVFAGLVLFRDEPWVAGEQEIGKWLANAYSHAWLALKPRASAMGARGRFIRRVVVMGFLAALIAAMFLPVRLSAVATATVVPLQPVVMTAPYDGLIKSIDVAPFAAVKKGAVLFRLDDTVVRSRYEVALRSLDVARAELRRVSRRAFADPESKAQIAVLEKRLRLRASEARYHQSLLARTVVRAPIDGIAIFSDRNDWIGKPVRIGQKIMDVARPDRSTLEVDLPVSDAIALEIGAPVVLYLDTAPLKPLDATVTRTSYEPIVSDDRVAIYRLRATFKKGTKSPRLGARGTAKIYGEEVPLYFYLFRRPIAEIRRMTGL